MGAPPRRRPVRGRGHGLTGSSIPRFSRGGRGEAILTLSVAQLTIDQRIAQAAVRTADDAVSQMERGLVNDDLADRSIGADALAPGVVTGP